MSNYIFQLLHSNVDEEIESSLVINKQIHSHNTSGSRICLMVLRFQLFIAFTERKVKVPFSMAIGNLELMHECFPKHLRMETTRMK